MTQLINRWADDPTVRAASIAFGDGQAVVASAIAIQQIAAPTFDEQQRAEYVAGRMRTIGLADVQIDPISNVFGRRPGKGNGPALLIAAHLDTVFPHGTDLAIRREGTRIYGPGLGDNSLGVAGLLHLAEVMQRFDIPQHGDVWFVGNVGEEGLGDLRGMRAAVDRLEGTIGAAIALEGCDQGRILHEAIGVRRYRITATAEGGHSWQNFGAPSAIHVLVQIAAQLTQLATSQEPKSSFNIGVIEGGNSVNSIAQHASLLLDLRAAQPAALQDLVRQVEQLLGKARDAEPRVEIVATVVGDRPAGRIPRNHRLVQLATAAYRSVGAHVSYDAGSTDANIPLSRGIPAVCVAIGEGEHAHRLDEYIEPAEIPAGMRALLLLTLAATTAP